MSRAYESSSRYSNRGPFLRSASSQQSFGANEPLKLVLENVPHGHTTADIYDLLKDYGLITRIDISKQESATRSRAYITFNPILTSPQGMIQRFNSMCSKMHSMRQMYLHTLQARRPLMSNNTDSASNAQVTVAAARVGITQDKETVLLLQKLTGTGVSPLTVKVNAGFRRLVVTFGATSMLASNDSPQHSVQESFRIHMPLSEIVEIQELQGSDGQHGLVMRCSSPPLLYRRPRDIDLSQGTSPEIWNEDHALLRQTNYSDDNIDMHAPTQLRLGRQAFDIGRWLTYFFEFDAVTAESAVFRSFCNVLVEHSVPISSPKSLRLNSTDTSALWTYTEALFPAIGTQNHQQSQNLSDLYLMGDEAIYLAFEVQYQLEACLSHGIINEANIDKSFIKTLSDEKPEKACKLLERAMDAAQDHRKHEVQDPKDIIDLLPSTFIKNRKIPEYCAMMRSIVVTPTTMYINSPALEPSNRVIRKYKSCQDRFLRVKFTDERYKGKIFSDDDNKMDALFERIKRTMVNGIKIGGRTYEFLAFGNSQFREGGAYFFANTNTVTATQIREKIGKLDHITEVAKHCSRLGQGFSTTRAMRNGVNLVRLQDTERNGYNFTDGVGKISAFMARMIAEEHGLQPSPPSYPSAFQFRLAGCKGVLVVDPAVTGLNVHIRPSQEKFPADYHGLEICRISRFASANLNVQLVLVLSCLGVPDEYFLKLMHTMLQDLELAMTNENKAVEFLQKNIDFNHVTIKLAEIIQNGFMRLKEPFMITCLYLWRSWITKYLKEKARIFVEKGTFVLGCVDESGVLRGHFDITSDTGAQPGLRSKDPTVLPQIFLQIPSTTKKGEWNIIKGPCVVARNPSLHPGDVRVVNAVDATELHHIRNCVVFPQTGDRDIPNMLSGGDLDGDDFIIIWDPDLLPREWNHPPMDYSPPPPVRSRGAVTVNDMISFFVEHMKHDNLARIAVAHRYWADYCDDGVKNEKCIELAQLHSRAVDFQKTGVPAVMPARLRCKHRPHWAFTSGKYWYKSGKIIGKLYDKAQQEPFKPAWDLPFDDRILNAYDLPEEILMKARRVKQQYDTSIRRLMSKFGIESEFEVWTTFVLKHSNDIGDYKFAETLGEAVHALKEHHQEICFEEAGTSRFNRDIEVTKVFVAAMYTVTAAEVREALDRYPTEVARTCKTMPLISFPWIFADDLGRIARQASDDAELARQMTVSQKSQKEPRKTSQPQTHEKPAARYVEKDDLLGFLPEIQTEEGTIHGGEVLDIFHKGTEASAVSQAAHVGPSQSTSSYSPTSTNSQQMSTVQTLQSPALERLMIASQAPEDENNPEITLTAKNSNVISTTESKHTDTIIDDSVPNEKQDDKSVEKEDDEEGEVTVTIQPSESTALDALDAFFGL